MPVSKEEPRYDVFISYRRGTAYDLALLLQTKLQHLGVNAFLDRDLRRGVFDQTLLRTIEQSTSFLVILTPNALDRCSDPGDWLRKEIVQAIESGRNIIPLTDSFQFTPEVVGNLDPAIRELPRYQAVVCSRDYLDSTIERIVKIVEEDKVERAEKERLASLASESEKKQQEKNEAQQEARERAQRIREQRQLVLGGAERIRGAQAMPAARPSPVARPNPVAFLRHRRSVWATGLVVFIAGAIGTNFYFRNSIKPGVVQVANQPTPTPIPLSIVPGLIKGNDKDGQKYVWIPSGTFQMGCSAGDMECDSSEKPSHSVTITKGFWLGQTPVTQAAYQRVAGNNPSYFKG